MKSFQQHLEEDSKWVWGYQNNPMELILNSGIPLSDKFMSFVFDPPTEHAYHFFEAYEKTFDKLLSLEGSRKTISCIQPPSRDISYSNLEYGVAGSGGCVAVVQGKKLASFASDAWTLVDKSGRRWITIDYTEHDHEGYSFKHVDGKLKRKFQTYYREFMASLMKKYENDILATLNQNKIEYFKTKFFPLFTHSRVSMDEWNGLKKSVKNKKAFNKVMHRFIKDYIDFFQKKMYEHREEFKKAWYNLSPQTKKEEVLMNNINIKHVLIEASMLDGDILSTCRDNRIPFTVIKSSSQFKSETNRLNKKYKMGS